MSARHFLSIFKQSITCFHSHSVLIQVEPYNRYRLSMATPTIGGPLNVKGSEAPATISNAAHTYLSAGKQLELKVSFEEYLHYASITRSEERIANEAYRNARGPSTIKSLFLDRFRISSKGHNTTNKPNRQGTGASQEMDEKEIQAAAPNTGPPASPVDSPELHTANRALRTAGWGSVFYLITTDILGPSNTP